MEKRPVKILSPEVARKIAAGEVIDRPNAIVRELMDNAVDSGADSVTVEINAGGIEKIRVSDNGEGMTKEDLRQCAHPHATSKIIEAADLMNLSTLGFRGEALASIAAVSRLSIASGNWKMRASLTEDHILEEIPAVQNGKGTIVSSEGLFENYPARRQFLKRPASENMMCRETFVEKALPRPDISFRFKTDGELRLDLPKNVSLAERFVSALEFSEGPEFFAELKGSDGNDWSFKLIIGAPEVYRNDRKHIYIYVNGRRVSEYSLLQAIEYGCQGFFPNGTHPVAVLFVQMNPQLVDFNIHPAKKEVRFKDSSALHHGVSSTVKEYFRSYGIKNSQMWENNKTEESQLQNIPGFDFGENSSSSANINESDCIELNDADIKSSIPASFTSFNSKNSYSSTKASSAQSDLRSKFFSYDSSPSNKAYDNIHSSGYSGSSLAFKALEEAEIKETKIAETPADSSIKNPAETEQKQDVSVPQFTVADNTGFSFIGTTMDCFLVAQKDDVIYFIDQHAAHERILFNKIISSKAETQNLLIPYVIETQSTSDEKYLENSLEVLKDAGFTGKNTGDGKFEFSTVPARWKGTAEDLRSAILDKLVDPKDLIYSVAAMTACKAAVKDGYVLDRGAAEALAKEALTLTDPHCPHGRPVWTTLSKEQLFARVRRTR